MNWIQQFLGAPEQSQDPNIQPALARYMQPGPAATSAMPRGAENPIYDAMIQAGAGLMAPGNLGQRISAGLTGFNKGLDDATTRNIAARKLSLEELRASKPSVTQSGVPGHVLLTYPDGRTETVVNDAAVAAYEAQQQRIDERQKSQFQQQNDMLDKRLAAQAEAQAKALAQQAELARQAQASQAALLEKRLAGNNKLNPTLQKSEDADIEAIQGAEGIIRSTTPLIKNLDDGSLQLGALRNAWNASKNFLGKSTPESEKYAELEREVTRITNEALRLNKGVQTEGDAQRAAKELQAGFAKNDSKVMAQALRDLQEINQRAATNKAKIIDQRRTSQNVAPLYGGQSPVTPGADGFSIRPR